MKQFIKTKDGSIYKRVEDAKILHLPFNKSNNKKTDEYINKMRNKLDEIRIEADYNFRNIGDSINVISIKYSKSKKRDKLKDYLGKLRKEYDPKITKENNDFSNLLNMWQRNIDKGDIAKAEEVYKKAISTAGKIEQLSDKYVKQIKSFS